MATQNACDVLDALSDFQLGIMDFVNRKFIALRRLADLLENLGDTSLFFPDISRLVPISQLDLTIYDDLQIGCPFLGIPPSEGATSAVVGLQAQLNAAYGRLISDWVNSPWIRMGSLQAEMDKARLEFDLAMLEGYDYLNCLSTICSTFQAAGSLVSQASSLSVTQQTQIITDYAKNIVTDGGKVLTDAAQAKVDDTQQIIDEVSALRDVEDLPDLPVFGG